ncbi:MAG: hypothetical protein V3S94_02340, partial [Gammaproteobacteria bacterium]
MSTEVTVSQIEQAFHEEDTQTTAEHISLGSYEADITSATELNDISSRFKVSNRLHGTRFSYVLYEEGFLQVR